MKSNSFPAIYWQYAKEKLKKPFLYIDRSINRYSLTQDKKKGCKCNPCTCK